MHEREWRIPASTGSFRIADLQAILVGSAEWRPGKVTSTWVDRSTGEPVDGPDGSPYAEPAEEEYPRLWRETPVWVWDRGAQKVVEYKPGELC